MEERDTRVTPQVSPGQGRSSDPAEGAASEFICPGCGRPLDIVLHSTMCFAEAQVYCPDCERDYQQKRGRWAGQGEDSARPSER